MAKINWNEVVGGFEYQYEGIFDVPGDDEGLSLALLLDIS